MSLVKNLTSIYRGTKMTKFSFIKGLCEVCNTVIENPTRTFAIVDGWIGCENIIGVSQKIT